MRFQVIRAFFSILIVCVSLQAHAEGEVFHSFENNRVESIFPNEEWELTRPGIDRIFLKHKSKKKFALIVEYGSAIKPQDAEKYLAGKFPREAKVLREAAYRDFDTSFSGVVATSYLRDGRRIGKASYSFDTGDMSASIAEHIWVEDHRIWQIVYSTVSSNSSPSQRDEDSDVATIYSALANRKTQNAWLKAFLPEAKAQSSEVVRGPRATSTQGAPAAQAAPAGASDCRGIPREKVALPPGVKIDRNFLNHCTPAVREGFGQAMDSAQQMMIAGYRHVMARADENVRIAGCRPRETAAPNTALGWIYVAGRGAYAGLCTYGASFVTLGQSIGDLAAMTIGGAISFVEWMIVEKDKVKKAINMVTQHVRGFLCLNATEQAKATCQFIGVASGVITVTAAGIAVTGGAGVFATTSGMASGARAVLIMRAATNSVRAAIVAPIATATETRQIVRRLVDSAVPERRRAAAAARTATTARVAAVAQRARSSETASPTGAAAPVTERQPRWRLRETTAQFRQRMINYDPTTDEQRRDMMNFVFSSRARGVKILDVENAFLKDLNDKDWLRENGGPFKKDRDLVTALTNQHKEILQARMQEFARRHAGNLELKSYSDFKSFRFALIPLKAEWKAAGIPESVMADLEATYRAVNEEFARKVADLGIESKKDPRTWFLAGLDNSADDANLNARFARDIQNHDGGIVRSDSPQIQQMRVQAYRDITTARARFDSLPQSSPLLDTVDGTRIPKPEIFDIVKKSGGSQERLVASLRSLYPGTDISDQTARDLIEYAQRVDRFQPGIWQSSREVATVAEAQFGGVTIDVMGMGSNNAYQTALQAARCSSLSFITQCTRDGERTVTREFRDRMNAIRDVSMATCERHGLQCFVRISGDDVVVIPTNGALPRSFARENLTGINNAIGTGRIRQAEIPPGVATGPHRVELGQHGESLEKILRGNLNATGLAPKTRDLTFSVRMRTQVPNMGGVQFVISGPAAATLTAAERRTLMDAYRRSVDDFNAQNSSRTYSFTP